MMKIQWDLTICSLLHDGTGLGGRKSDLSQDHRSSHARARDTQAQGGADSTRMHTPTPARPQVQVSQTCTSKDRHTCWISERMESSSTRLLRTSLCSCKNHMPSRVHTCAGVRHHHVSFACEFTAHNPTCCTNLHQLVLLRERVSATSHLLQKGYRLTHGPARRSRCERQVFWPISAARFRQIAFAVWRGR